jgi:ribosomal protein L11 methyltransferase
MSNRSKNPIDDAIPNEILQFIAASPTKTTSVKLEKILSEQYKLEKQQIKSVIKDLVRQGELIYTYEFGSSFLERSFNKPARVSRYVVIKPPGYRYRPESEDIVVEIKPGAAFGDGRHPTTRLAIRGVEYVLKEFESDDFERKHTVLDIGTGTGILVITAVRLGMFKGIGIDIDPCARSEAEENVLINQLEDQIDISDQFLETIDQSFALVTANLRVPTLKKICSYLRKIVTAGGFIVFSGIRPHEMAAVTKQYSKKNFERLWKEQEQDWMGVVFRRSH